MRWAGTTSGGLANVPVHLVGSHRRHIRKSLTLGSVEVGWCGLDSEVGWASEDASGGGMGGGTGSGTGERDWDVLVGSSNWVSVGGMGEGLKGWMCE